MLKLEQMHREFWNAAEARNLRPLSGGTSTFVVYFGLPSKGVAVRMNSTKLTVYSANNFRHHGRELVYDQVTDFSKFEVYTVQAFFDWLDKRKS